MTKEQAAAIVDATLHGIKEERLRIVHLIKDTATNEEHKQHYAEDCWCSGWLDVVELVLGVKSE